MKQSDGQSMEDILASIRNIIADGGADGEPPQPGPVGEAFARAETALDDGDAPETESQLLELARIAREQGDDGILSAEARSAANESMSALEGTLIRGYPGSENTLDGVVKEMLRPMLKEWLDANLPMVVERMVAREITRITGK